MSTKTGELAEAQVLDECTPSKMVPEDARAYLQHVKWIVDCALEALQEDEV